MKTSTMRFFDKWLSICVCFILTLVRKLTNMFGPKMPDRIKRIVFVKLAEQGATVLAHTAIQKAIEKVGSENVFFVVFEDNRFILDALEVRYVDLKYPAIYMCIGISVLRLLAAIGFLFVAESYPKEIRDLNNNRRNNC